MPGENSLMTSLAKSSASIMLLDRQVVKSSSRQVVSLASAGVSTDSGFDRRLFDRAIQGHPTTHFVAPLKTPPEINQTIGFCETCVTSLMRPFL